MTDNVRELRPVKPAVPDVTGYVEAITESAALGWVWLPGDATRLSVELRIGEQVVAKGVADSPREDLARGGIGDGAHAFSLAVPDELRSRLSEVRVVACLPDGRSVILEAPPASQAADPVSRLQKSVDTLISSHRLMHRNLQAALVQRPANAGQAIAELSAAQTELKESIETLERFVVRIEARLPATPADLSREHPRSGAIWGALTLAALALAGSGTALFFELFGR